MHRAVVIPFLSRATVETKFVTPGYAELSFHFISFIYFHNTAKIIYRTKQSVNKIN